MLSIRRLFRSPSLAGRRRWPGFAIEPRGLGRCSLAGGTTKKGRTFPGPPLRLFGYSGSIVVVTLVPDKPHLGDLALLGHGQNLIDQHIAFVAIGRASYRDRVCANE